MAKYIIGIDEVGRGCLAGPVVVAAVCISTRFITPAHLGPVRDSKKLTVIKREEWARYLHNDPRVMFAVSRALPRTIEKINISQAANRAALQSLRRVCKKHAIDPVDCRIYLDGGLFLGEKRKTARGQEFRAATMIKADEKLPAVALASIVAKVYRDRYMKKMATRYAGYQFEVHKGYATAAHRAALAANGPCDIHRLTFVHKYAIVNEWEDLHITQKAK